MKCAICKAVELVHHRARYCHDCRKVIKRIHKAVSVTVAGAVKRGALKSIWTQKCVDCGAPASDYDHRDYGKPLEVQPVCNECNIKRGPALKFGWRGIEARKAAREAKRNVKSA